MRYLPFLSLYLLSTPLSLYQSITLVWPRSSPKSTEKQPKLPAEKQPQDLSSSLSLYLSLFIFLSLLMHAA